MDGESNSPLPALPEPRPESAARAMVKAELGGQHTNEAADGTKVHIWQRDGQYLARGSWLGRRFGQQLGSDPREAMMQLRALLGEMDRGAFSRPSERLRQITPSAMVPRLTLAELVEGFVADVRRRKGKNTADNYADRLAPGLEFAYLHPKRWPLAQNLSPDFATEFKAYLFQRRITPNGHPQAEPRRMAPGHIHNVLACWGTMVHWATRDHIRRLPIGFPNPFNRDVVGQRPRRDPLAPPTFPLQLRVELIKAMDAWQLAVLALPLVLPERPEDFVGLLVSEVDRTQRCLHFGTRCGGDDTTKAGVAFHVPYPPELDPIMDWLIAGRAEGPLLRSRRALLPGKKPTTSLTVATLAADFDRFLARLPGYEIMAQQDRKRHFRRFLVKHHGISTDTMSHAFHAALERVRPGLKARFYDLKGSVTTDMKDAGVDYITRLYLTGHSLGKEILAAYETQRLQEHTARYFQHIGPLLQAIRRRASELGMTQ